MRRLGGLVLVCALTGCGGAGPSTTATVTVTVTSTGGGTAAPTGATSTASAKTEGTVPFGSTLTRDGVSITVSAPAAFTPGEYSAGGTPGKPSSAFDVTLKNESSKPFKPGLMMMRVTSGDTEVKRVFDGANGIEDPTAEVLPGKSLKWRVAYAVPHTSPMDMQVKSILDDMGVYRKA